MRDNWLKAVFGAVLAMITLSASEAAAATLTGEVTYRERIALPAGASLRIRLVDLTATGTPARVEANAPISSPGQVPLSFTLNFDDRVINATHDHALVAEISVGTDLWFRNAEPYRLSPLAPAARLLVIPACAGRLGGAAASPAPAPATASVSDGEIINVTWRATHLRGEPAIANSEPTLSIAEDLRAGGRGGCNNYFTQATITGASIRFSAVGSTRMACLSEALSEQEAAFFEALATARAWRVSGDQLLLLGASGAELARFARAIR